MANILQVLPALDGGGVERGTLEVAAALVDAGHRSLVVSAGGRMVQELEAAGSQHVSMPIGRKSPATLRLIPRLQRLLRDQAIDLVHVRSRFPAWMMEFALRGMPAGARPARVATMHGLHSVSRYSAVMTRGDRVIAVSESVRAHILQHYPKVDPGRLRTIFRGVDPAAYPYGYQPDSAWLAACRTAVPALADGRFLVALPGRITRLKGHLDLIEAGALLKEQGVPIHLLVIGGVGQRHRRYQQELRDRALALGVADAISFTGARSDLRELMAIADVVVSLSTRPESFGRTTLEALSLGRPVLGYAHGGVGEQLEALYPAGLVPVGSVPAVADRLRLWFEHGAPPVAPGHGFTLARMLDRTLALYDEVLSGRAG